MVLSSRAKHSSNNGKAPDLTDPGAFFTALKKRRAASLRAGGVT
jgi:hypothetical protein